MKKSLHITTSLDQPDLLENLVEKLAHKADIGFGKVKLPQKRIALETSSTDTFLSGTIGISGEGQSINMPFITRFIFTCVKDKKNFKLAWSTSLS